MADDSCARSPDGRHRWITLAAGEVCEACGKVRMPEKPPEPPAGATAR
jgi:hypothetical protein